MAALRRNTDGTRIRAFNSMGAMARDDFFGRSQIWFIIVPYETVPCSAGVGGVCRRLPLGALQALHGNGGAAMESEFIGNQALVKIRASSEMFGSIATRGWFKFRAVSLSAVGSGLDAYHITQIQQQLLAAGYLQSEIDTAIPNFQTAAMQTILNLFLTRRVDPSWNGNSIVFTGTTQSPLPLSVIDSGVQ